MEEKNSPIIEIYNILKEKSDENHPLTKADIFYYLSLKNIEISDDTLTKCIKQINQQLDVDIAVTKGRYAKYQMNSKLFKYSELKLIIDAVNSSSVIDEKTTEDIVEKLKKSASTYEAKELERSSTGVNKAKTQNTQLLDNIDMIQKAFQERVQIEFDYMEWTSQKKLKIKEIVSKTSGKKFKHSIEPWKLFWANDRYYLFGYDTFSKDGEYKIRNYRVDKMCNIRLLEEKRKCIDNFSQFDMDTYVAQHMGMYGEKIEGFEVEVPEWLVGAFLDQFGTDIRITKSQNEGKQIIKFRSAASPIVLGWLIGLGEVKIIKPETAIDKMKELLQKNMDRFNEQA